MLWFRLSLMNTSFQLLEVQDEISEKCPAEVLLWIVSAHRKEISRPTYYPILKCFQQRAIVYKAMGRLHQPSLLCWHLYSSAGVGEYAAHNAAKSLIKTLRNSCNEWYVRYSLSFSAKFADCTVPSCEQRRLRKRIYVAAWIELKEFYRIV